MDIGTRSNIGQAQFDRALQDAPDDRALRISKNTGQVTSAQHGFLARLVRFFKGPTDQDVADNQHIMKSFVSNLSARFGPDVAKAALLQVRGQDAPNEAGRKPLTARQARLVTATAEKAVSEKVATGSQLFGPASKALADAIDDAGVNPDQLKGKEGLLQLRLKNVMQQKAAQGDLPDWPGANREQSFSQLKSIAVDVVKEVANTPLDAAKLQSANAIAALKQQGIEPNHPQWWPALVRFNDEIGKQPNLTSSSIEAAARTAASSVAN